MNTRRRHAVVLALLCSSACTEETLPPLELAKNCQPLLAGADCFLPYPSDYFLVDDDTMPTGKRVHHDDDGASKLFSSQGWSADVNDFIPMDGYSRVPNIVALLGVALKDEGMVHINDDPERTLLPSNSTLILDAETGERVVHFVDLDPRADDKLRQAIVFHPLTRLQERHRYVVVLQGLVADQGGLATTPEGYRRLRDKQAKGDPVLEPLAARYEAEVFPVLERAGVERAATQLVWDFSTGADEWAVTDMLRARELALAALEETPPTVEVSAMYINEDDRSWRTIFGRITGPLVMTGVGGPGSALARDDAGEVRLNGTMTFDFMAVVPNSVRDGFEAGIPLVYGHGFFGAQGELGVYSTPKVLDAVGAVGFAVDWLGMSDGDLGVLIPAIGEEVYRSLEFGERVPQAMVNFMTLRAAIEGPMRALPEFQRPLDVATEGGGVVVDPSDSSSTNAGAPVYEGLPTYLGISQGHILGGVLAALEPKIERYVLNVGGAAYTHMMMRAGPFKQYLALYEISMPDPLDQQKVIATLSRGFDRFDPVAYASYVLREDLPFGPPSNRENKRLLLQIGIGDTQVPNFASWLHARLLDVPLLTPSPREPWGVTQTAGPVEGSALSIFDFGIDDSFDEVASPPTIGTPAHEGVRKAKEAQEQMRTFLREGRIDAPCGEVPCVLEP